MNIFGCPVTINPIVPADEVWVVNPNTGAVEDIMKIMRGSPQPQKDQPMNDTVNAGIARTTSAPLAQTIPQTAKVINQGSANRLVNISEQLRDKVQLLHDKIDTPLGSGPRTAAPAGPQSEPSGQLEYIEQVLRYVDDLLDGLGHRLNNL